VEVLGAGPMSRSSIILLGIGLTAAVLMGYFIFVSQVFDNWSDRGAFGDTFNALLSAGALTGVMIAILLQREELKHQRGPRPPEKRTGSNTQGIRGQS